jgi:hypothetical protein
MAEFPTDPNTMLTSSQIHPAYRHLFFTVVLAYWYDGALYLKGSL